MNPKYTTDQLRAMATTALTAKARGDIRYVMLVAHLSTALQMPGQLVEAEIQRLAQPAQKAA